jgi:hypothetical protein
MSDAKQLRQSIKMLLAERAAIKCRNQEIARKLHLLRVKLSRLPDAGDDTPDATPQGNVLDALDDFLNNL